jgi:DNA topoisomerase IA
MEADLDEIAKGEKKSRTVLKTFWDVFVRDIGRVH